ncbi:MAG: hypothetical protein C0190_04740 [Thermodesulfobacterium geofontis]|uniref:DUF3373 domain-containing protein n=1 Tax=Thermodesulfobacterium geofontis TaxID=1295609 RepID=A0A2N7PN25_9BACT|nr:MAG: hypothetical protein C0190_04740 [Thermodesulfobacterium geofontis]
MRKLKVIFKKFLLSLGMCTSLVLTPHYSFSSDSSVDTLIKVLVKKGILTEDEAKEIKKEVEAETKKQKEEVITATVEKIKKDISSFLPSPLRGLSVGTLTYIDYSNGYLPNRNQDKKGFSYFSLTRGYINIKKDITPWLSFRITPDIKAGNVDTNDLRLKYAYALFQFPNLGFLTDIISEFGLGHFPWLDFEETINPYRMQGYMPREFVGTFNSADRGFSIAGNLGGNLEESYVKKLTYHYPTWKNYIGKHGSWWLSYMNGVGYENAETNIGKAIEGRLTLRPFPYSTKGLLPLAGLQFSYFFISGTGGLKADNNYFRSSKYPRYDVHLGMLSYQHPWFVITLQYSQAYGNHKGTWVVTPWDNRNERKVLKNELWSVFADVVLPVFNEKLHLFVRYDWIDPNSNVDRFCGDSACSTLIPKTDDTGKHYMIGFAYYLHENNILMLNFEWMNYDKYYRLGTTDQFHKMGVYDPSGKDHLKDTFRVQTVLQISF